MPTSYLTRIVEFTATHRIRRADWPAERNALEFGKAAVDHGHRYQCRVTVKGSLAPEAGGVMSLVSLDAAAASWREAARGARAGGTASLLRVLRRSLTPPPGASPGRAGVA